MEQLASFLQAGDAEGVLSLFRAQQDAAREGQALLQDQLQNVLKLNAELQAAVEADRPVPESLSSALRFSLPKAPRPEHYHGVVGKPPSVRVWVKMLRQYFSIWPDLTESQKLHIAAMFLRGHAWTWWCQAQSMADAGMLEPIVTFDTFETAICHQFAVVDEEEQARRELTRLRHLTSVAAFNRRWMETLLLLPKGDKAYNEFLISMYVSKLKQRVQESVRLSIGAQSPDKPMTLDQVMALAERVDNVQNPSQASGSGSSHLRSKGRSYSQAVRGSSGSGGSGPAPMELGSVRLQPRAPTDESRRTLTRKEREYLDSIHACYYCRRKNAGHMARECPLLIKHKGKAPVSNSRNQ